MPKSTRASPAALNALNLNMVRRLLRFYTEWGRAASANGANGANAAGAAGAAAPAAAVRCVVSRGAGGRAFCAGGDVKANVLLARAGREGAAAALEFFREEYLMDAALGALPLPHVALLDGVVMGGGAGASLHGMFRLATERCAVRAALLVCVCVRRC